MSKFSPTDIDALLNAHPQQPTVADVPDGFFENMEERILAAVAADSQPVSQTETQETPVVALTPRHSRRKWTMAAAAAVLLFVCAFAAKYGFSITQSIDTTEDIYAVHDDMSDDDIEILGEIYDADLFLEEL